MRAVGILGAVLAFCVTGIGCAPQGTAPEREMGRAPNWERGQDRDTFTRSEPIQREVEGRKLRFLNSVRDADPEYQTIERAVMNAQNELGIILSRNVAMEDIPKLMRGLLKQMASEFPGEDLTIIAYAPSDPPIKIGTGRLNAATREMTYIPAQR